MPSYKPHWSPDADYSSCPFFIRRMDTVGYFKPAEAPVAQSPLVGFIYVASGEVLAELFNMLATSFEKGDSVFVEKGLDLLLSRLKPNLPATIPAAVSSFLFFTPFQKRDGYNAICLPKKDARIILIPSIIGLKYHAAYSELCSALRSI